ncbi:hypothetical protein KDX31_08065 [Amphritea atlantica]|uniref:Uncharacterized protein n=1 Tax=Amphritea atlantica TaxID=355243 RepID=A0ABY5H1D1_9GAMM|nr:hypothetical protein KDX31_08065 [Amphritea atlantica]
MEEVVEGFFKVFLRLIGVVIRALLWLIWEMFFEVIAWYVGWPICRILSLGHHPEESINEHEQASSFQQFMVSVVGLLFLIGSATLIAWYAGEI